MYTDCSVCVTELEETSDDRKLATEGVLSVKYELKEQFMVYE
jgi:hypothetical protein